jgi:hypothetical protein
VPEGQSGAENLALALFTVPLSLELVTR